MDHVITVGMVFWIVVGALGVIGMLGLIALVLSILAEGYTH